MATMDKALDFQCHEEALVLVRAAHDLLLKARKNISHRNKGMAKAINGHAAALFSLDESLRQAVLDRRDGIVQ